jgi:hypothetical protein
MIPIDKVVHGQAISNANHRGGGTSQKKSRKTAGWHARGRDVAINAAIS